MHGHAVIYQLVTIYRVLVTVFDTGVPSFLKDLTRNERDTSSLERETKNNVSKSVNKFKSIFSSKKKSSIPK